MNKKNILLSLLFITVSTLVFASQMFVVGEVFSSVT